MADQPGGGGGHHGGNPRLHLRSSLQQARLEAVTAHASRDGANVAAAPSAKGPSTPGASSSTSAAAYVQASAALRRLPDTLSQEVSIPRAALHLHRSSDSGGNDLDSTSNLYGGRDARTRGHTTGGTKEEEEEDSTEPTSSTSRDSLSSSSQGVLSDGTVEGEAASPHGDADGEREDSTGAEEDAVAARILQSMQRKDAVIARLTEQLQALTRAGTAHTAEGEKEPTSPSSPPTASRSLQATASPPPLTEELRKKEEELALLREELAVAQQQWELKEVALESREREAAVLSTHIKKLEMQLDDALQEKRDDVSTLKEHIEHLQRELRDKADEVKRKERRHRTELAALQKDIVELSVQFESQMGTVEQQRKLADDLAEAKRREQDIIFENQQMQRRWLRELEVQKRLVGELQQQQQQQQQQHQQQQGTSTMAAARHQQQDEEERQRREREVRRLSQELHQCHAEKGELSRAHALAEEEIGRLRLDTRLLTENVSELTLALQQAQGQRDALVAQVQALGDALRHAEEALAAKEAEARGIAESHARQLEGLLREEDSRQQTVLSQVEGCVRSTAKLEDALRTSEEKRRSAEARARQCEDERALALSEHRQAQAQARQDMLDQQKLAASVTDYHKEKLQEAHAQLREQAGLLASAKDRATRLESLLADTQHDRNASEAAHAQLVVEYQSTMAAQQRVCQDLVATKEELRKALTLQLEATQTAQALDGKLARLQSQQQQQRHKLYASQEREQVLCRSVHELALLAESLWTARGALRTLPHSRVGAVGGAFSTTSTATPPTGEEMMVEAADASVEGEAQGEDEVVVPVPVSLSENSLNCAAGQENHRHALPPLLPHHHQLQQQQQQLASSIVSSSSTASASTARLSPFSAALRALRANLMALAERWADARRDLAAKKALVVQLEKEKARLVAKAEANSAQHERAVQAQATQFERERRQLRQDAAHAAKEAQALAQAAAAASEDALRQQHEQRWQLAQQRAQQDREAAASALAVEITSFIRDMPTILADSMCHRWLSNGVGDRATVAATGAGEEEGRERGSAVTAADGDTDRGGEVLVVDIDTPRKDIQAECDTIAKELLGLSGGYADFTTLLAKAADTSKQQTIINEKDTNTDNGGGGGGEGRVVVADALNLTPTTMGSHHPHHYPVHHTLPQQEGAFQPPIAWEASQLQELTDVLAAYLASRLSASSSSGSGHRRRKEQHGQAEHVSPSLPSPPPMETKEEEEESSRTSALHLWVQSLRASRAGGQQQQQHRPRKKVVAAASPTVSFAIAAAGEDEEKGTKASLLTELLTVCALHSIAAPPPPPPSLLPTSA